MHRSVPWIVLLAIASGLQAGAPDRQAVEPFTIAVVSESSGRHLLQPIARFTGSVWLNTWPALVEGAPVPETVAQVPAAWLDGPVPTEWHVWLRAEPKRLVKVDGVIRAVNVCYQPVELMVAGRPAFSRGRAGTSGGTGIAATRDVVVHEVNDALREGGEAARVVELVRMEFAARARQAVADFRNFDRWLTPALLSESNLDPISIEILMRPAGASATRTYYFDAMRRVTRDVAKERLHGVAVSGWIRIDDAGAAVIVEASGRVMDEMSTGVLQVPLAVLHDAGRELWVLRRHFYESVGYSLVEVGPNGVTERATANGGGC